MNTYDIVCPNLLSEYDIELNPVTYIDAVVKNIPRRYRVSAQNEMILNNSTVQTIENAFMAMGETELIFGNESISTAATKKITISNGMAMDSDAITLIIAAYPESSEFILESSAQTIKGRARLVSEMDDKTLDEFDGTEMFYVDIIVE